MAEREEALNAIGQYVEIDGWCFPIECNRVWENDHHYRDSQASGAWGDYAEKEFPVLRMSLIPQEREMFLGDKYSAKSFLRLRDDPPTAKWLTEEAMQSRIEGMVAERGHQWLIDLCGPVRIPQPDGSHHSKWDWEPGYGPSY